MFSSALLIEFSKELRRVPRVACSDVGTGKVLIQDMQITLLNFNSKWKCYGALWKKIFTQCWRNLFKDLIDEGIFNNADPLHIECIRRCFLNSIQGRLNIFRQTWNLHRIRSQRNVDVCCGIPNIMYYQPILYDIADYPFPLPCDMTRMYNRESFRNFHISISTHRLLWRVSTNIH